MFFMRIKINLGSNLELFTTGNDAYQSYTTVVSIHAPARGTTAILAGAKTIQDISINAPT